MASEFLTRVLHHYKQARPQPYVTLTFAESSDGKIAGKHGQQLALSGKESMVMTHWMRTMHDAILVGIGTALNDDPQLNTRHLPPSTQPYHLPRPVILDTHLRLNPTCKLLVNYQQGRGRRPWIICALSESSEWTQRSTILQNAGARIIPIPTDAGLLPIPLLIQKLSELGIQSLMVEGGARVIQTFLAKASIDAIIITTAPTVVGEQGLGHNLVFGVERTIPGFNFVAHEKFGEDDVFAWIRAT